MMRRLIHLIALATALTTVTTGAGADAVGRDRGGTLTCTACHGGAARHAVDPVTGEVRDLSIRMDRFRGADHGDVPCLECHVEGVDSFPHTEAEMLGCMGCHPRDDLDDAQESETYDFPRMEEQFRETVHYTEHPQAFTCEGCHDPHYFRATARLATPRVILQDNNVPCLNCHTQDAVGPLADPSDAGLVADHAWLRHTELHMDNTRCVDCHTDTDHPEAHDLRVGDDAEQGCVSCHTLESILISRLYRYHAEKDGHPWGFTNPVLLDDGYVMGANRHVLFDRLTYLLLGVPCLVLAFSALVRGLRARVRTAGGVLTEDEDGMRVPPWVRLWHWTTAVLFALLIVTGAVLRFATADTPIDYAWSVTLHEVGGVAFAIVWVLFMILLIATGRWRVYIPGRRGFWGRLRRDLVYHGLGGARGDQAPRREEAGGRFNAVQQIAYAGMLFLVLPLIGLSGLLYLYPEEGPALLGLEQLWPLALFHYGVSVLGTVFFVVHVLMATLGPEAVPGLKRMTMWRSGNSRGVTAGGSGRR